MDENIKKIIKAKDHISIFKNMEDRDIERIVQNVNFIQYQPNELIIKEGDSSKEIFLLVSGKCEVHYHGKVVATLHENEPFGEFAPITHQKRKATIIAKTDVKVISFRLNISLLENTLQGFSILYKNFSDELIKKLEVSNKR